MKLLYINNGTSKDISAISGSYSRSDNVDSLGMEFNFTLLNNPLDENYSGNELEIGGKIICYNDSGKMIFSGIIVKYDRSDVSYYKYKCYDYGFYLNKSEVIIQFNNIPISEALNKLCSEYSIPIGSICQISTMVNKIYYGDTISDVIKDLLKLAGNELAKNYRLEVRENKLYIEKYEKLVISAVFNIIGSFDSSYSIENMKNKITVVSSSEKNQQIFATEEDKANQNTFGILTKVEKIDDKKSSEAMQVAKNKLKELNKVTKTFSVTLFGNDDVRAGRVLVFNQPEINLKGAFLVKNCTHNYDGAEHYMRLDLEV